MSSVELIDAAVAGIAKAKAQHRLAWPYPHWPLSDEAYAVAVLHAVEPLIAAEAYGRGRDDEAAGNELAYG